MGLKITLDATFTVGDLNTFSDLARAARVTPDTAVEPVVLEQDDSIVDYYELQMPSGFSVSAIGSSDETDLWREARSTGRLRELVEALDGVIEDGGDARYVLAELREIRSLLR